MRTYWQKRRERNKGYYKQVVDYARTYAPHAQSSLDVGNYGCEYVYEFDWIARRCVLDIRDEMFALDERIEKIRADFLTWRPPRRYDLVTCLQVLEHFHDPLPFIQKLREVQQGALIISLPYMWPDDRTADHKHDPIDLEKIHRWLGSKSTAETIVTEENGTQRWMGVYLRNEAVISAPAAFSQSSPPAGSDS
jgi:hypothetical protein